MYSAPVKAMAARAQLGFMRTAGLVRPAPAPSPGVSGQLHSLSRSMTLPLGASAGTGSL